MPVIHAIDDVCADLTRLRYLFVNVYLWKSGQDWVLVDAALSGSAGAIVDAAKEVTGNERPPTAIILTHGHFDHVGALPRLLERWDVPVFAHRTELPHLTGERDYLPPDPLVGKGAMALTSFLYPSKAADFKGRVIPLPDDGSVPFMPGWRWIATDGHTDGHVSLFRDEDCCPIAGDAFVTVQQESLYDVVRQEPEVHGPPAYFTPDWNAARRSVEKLAALDPVIAATGHGTPMRGQPLHDGLTNLIQHFEEIAVPNKDRSQLLESAST